MTIRRILWIFSVSALLVSCGGDKDSYREISSYVASFVKDNDKVVAFGNIEMKDILDKLDYKSHDKLNAIVSGEMGKIEKVLNLSTPVYFVGEGPLNTDGSPSALHLFIEVRDQDSLVDELTRRSYDINTVKKIHYTEDGDFVMGVKNNLAIITIRGGEFDAKKLVQDNFARVEGEETNDKEKQMIAKEADLVLTLKLENLYGTSNTDLEKLDQSVKDEIIAMAKDSYLQTSIKFENGAATIETNNFFNDALKAQLFFRSDKNSKIINKLNKGDGSLMAGAAVNLDLDKMEAFYQKYSPETLSDINELLGVDGSLMALLGSEKLLSKLGDGQLGMTVYGNQDEYAVSANAFFGATDSGKRVFSFLQGSLPEGFEYTVDSDGIYGHGGLMGESMGEEATMSLPKGCEVFGTKGVTAFLSLQGFDAEEFGLWGTLKLFEIVDYATFEYDENGGKLYIKAKDGQENILKQAMGVVIEELASNISDIAF